MIPSPARFFRQAAFCVAYFGCYYLLNLPSVIFISKIGFSAWYPAAGLSAATVLGLNPFYGLLVLMTDPVVGHLIYGTPIFSWDGLTGSLGPACFYTMAALVLRGPWKIDISLRRRQDVLRYSIVTLLAAAGATSHGVGMLVLSHRVALGEYWESWVRWYAGESVGVIGVAPFLLIHVLPTVRKFLGFTAITAGEQRKEIHPPGKSATISSLLEFAMQIVAIPATMYVVVTKPTPMGHPMFLAFLPILWIAIRKGVRRVVTGNVVLITTTLAALSIFPIPQTSLLSASMALLLILATGLIVGASVSEQYRQARDLRDQTVYLNSLIENSPLAIVFLGLDKRMRVCNDAFLRLFQFTKEDMAATTLDRLIWLPELEEQGEATFSEVKSGRTVRTPTRRRRKDGAILDVELIAVPLSTEGVVRGVCWIYSDISERLRAAEETQRHSDQLNQMVQELQIHNTEMALLAELNSLLQCCATTKEAMLAVSQSAPKLFPGATAGALYRYNSEQRTLEQSVRWGTGGVSEISFERSACWGFRRGRAHWSDSPGGGVVCRHVHGELSASFLCVPMVTGNEAAGVLHLQVDRGEFERQMPGFESMMAGMERLAAAAAGQIGLAMASLEMREELQQLSVRDPLTGLYNRRTLEVSLQREIFRARRKRQPVCVLFIDLDHFKSFNDTHGHAAGDEILVRMARLFREFFRGEDVVCRYGGEEFAIVMPEAKPVDAAARAEMLRTSAEKMTIEFQGKALERVTLSMGIAAYPDHASTQEELLRVADECLYRSKAAGRNRVTLAASPAVLAPSGVEA
ncbi:MAG TPA: diguanylate cyclase [Candidatus Acidoferrum sp.]|nr:diguanylate cyclase [Candidatus Acidoferrum sp.]